MKEKIKIGTRYTEFLFKNNPELVALGKDLDLDIK